VGFRLTVISMVCFGDVGKSEVLRFRVRRIRSRVDTHGQVRYEINIPPAVGDLTDPNLPHEVILKPLPDENEKKGGDTRDGA